MLQEHTQKAASVSLNYAATTEDGPPLLLLHGVMGRWQNWLNVMPALSLRWQLYALDLRGHGRSEHVTDAYHIPDYAADVLAFIREVIGRPTVLIGHSLGAIISTAVAAAGGESVRAVVLEDPPLAAFRHERLRDRPEFTRFTLSRDLAASGKSIAEIAKALAAMPDAPDSAALRAQATRLHQLDPVVVTQVLEDRAKAGYDEDSALKSIRCPVLLLQGNPAHGGALKDADAAHAASLLSAGLHLYLPDVGHNIHSAKPLEFCRLVNDFLESL